MTEKRNQKGSDVRAMIERAIGGDVVAADDRELLLAYLKYAVDDVAQINETSAMLLQMAIADLEGKTREPGLTRPQ
jgi:hypothetical protein